VRSNYTRCTDNCHTPSLQTTVCSYLCRMALTLPCSKKGLDLTGLSALPFVWVPPNRLPGSEDNQRAAICTSAIFTASKHPAGKTQRTARLGDSQRDFGQHSRRTLEQAHLYLPGIFRLSRRCGIGHQRFPAMRTVACSSTFLPKSSPSAKQPGLVSSPSRIQSPRLLPQQPLRNRLAALMRWPKHGSSMTAKGHCGRFNKE